MFMLQCDEYQEGYDDEQRELEYNNSYASADEHEDWLNHQEQFATQQDYTNYLILCNALD